MNLLYNYITNNKSPLARISSERGPLSCRGRDCSGWTTCNVRAEVPRESRPKGYLPAFLRIRYAWDRGLGFSPEAAPSWDASALFQRTRLGQGPAGTHKKQD